MYVNIEPKHIQFSCSIELEFKWWFLKSRSVADHLPKTYKLESKMLEI